MSTLTCGRCGVTELQIFIAGILSDPPGWSELSLTGKPITNTRLCRSCTALVRSVLGEVHVIVGCECVGERV